MAMDKYRAVFHVDEGNEARVGMALKNIENLIADLGEENVQVELVTNGRGVTALVKTPSPHQEQIERLAAKGVRFAACANSLRQAGLTPDTLLGVVEVVPSGVGELVKKQAQGWAYIRP
jgi:intracellular sulfur oxidation DsrE/DsrF family protein